MTVFGIAMVKNEQDIIEPVIEHMLEQVDHIIVADNMSTDLTYDILETYPVTLIRDTEVAYEQSRKMTALAMRAKSEGADWVVPFDADEIWYSPHFDTISECLNNLTDAHVVPADLYDHRCSPLDPHLYNPIRRMGYRTVNPGSLQKVACRTFEKLTIHMGNHNCDYGGLLPKREEGQLVVRHFPYRSADQFVSKVRHGVAAIRKTDFDESVGAHWRQYGNILDSMGPQAIYDIYYQWYWFERPTENGLIYDPAPIK